jgi:hypothetical protein
LSVGDDREKCEANIEKLVAYMELALSPVFGTHL